jgi:hypothetical protein
MGLYEGGDISILASIDLASIQWALRRRLSHQVA